MKLSDIIPAALEELRAAGYEPTTGDEAVEMAMRYLGGGYASTAVYFLTGESDIVFDDGPPEESTPADRADFGERQADFDPSDDRAATPAELRGENEHDPALDPDDDKREGPSVEADLDAHHFLIPEVWGSYEDGEPLDLGKHGTLDPSGGEGIFSAKEAQEKDST